MAAIMQISGDCTNKHAVPPIRKNNPLKAINIV